MWMTTAKKLCVKWSGHQSESLVKEIALPHEPSAVFDAMQLQ